MKKLIIFALAVFTALSVYASDKTAGVQFPEAVNVGGQELPLNGAGLRKKFFIKVYAAGLYTAEKTADAKAAIDADAPEAIMMVMIYNGITPKQMKDSWMEGFEGNTADLAPLKERIDTLTSWFTADAKKNDVYDIVYEPEKGSSLIINGETKGTIPGLDFKKALFAIWLGDKPADKGLKEGMLGN